MILSETYFQQKIFAGLKRSTDLIVQHLSTVKHPNKANSEFARLESEHRN